MLSRDPADTGQIVSGIVRKFRVMEERETARGWSYRVVLAGDEAGESEHEVTLSWVDHNYWCGGTQAPSVTTEQVLETLLNAMADGAACRPMRQAHGDCLPGRFDLSLARRIVPKLDSMLRRAV
ncbi:MAG: hypothetical protein KF691_04300 [Phycisphaeraceae bacterium]|nr:hypothetical protein [Phycisphaeraceae bacterium]